MPEENENPNERQKTLLAFYTLRDALSKKRVAADPDSESVGSYEEDLFFIGRHLGFTCGEMELL